MTIIYVGQGMRKSKVEAAETRRRIVEVAAREFRLNGIHATGLADVMTQAGLTQGGFYRHFESKDQLVAEACAEATKDVVDALEVAASHGDGKEGFKAIVDAYVSTAHRDTATGGCPLAAMGSELARADEQTRAAASRAFNDLVDVLAKRASRRQRETARSDAVFALAAMVGAVTLSRIIEDSDVSLAVLRDVKQHLGAM
ncbi:TetR/AcrR family transcriptional regulator [Cupriavidus basilensis]